MNLNILGQNFLLFVCSITTALFVYLSIYTVTKHLKPKPRASKKALKKQLTQLRRNLAIIVIVSFVLSFIIKAIIGHYTESYIPIGIQFMLIPVCLSLVWVIVFWQAMPELYIKIISAFFVAFCFLFSLVLINNYYRYYPTLGSVFGHNQGVANNLLKKQVVLRYTPANGQSLLNTSSIEYDLTSVSSQPTDGKLYSINIPGTVSRFHARNEYVYVPAIYNNPTGISLPVLVLTAGTPGTPDNWVALGLQSILDNFAKHHDGITPLVVVADNTGSITNDTECVDSPRGNVETYLTVDVPNYIKANFNVQSQPDHWAIGGLSMGGTCSIMLALRHSNIYHYFLDYGGEMGPEVGSQETTINTLFAGSFNQWRQHQPEYLLQTRTYKKMGAFFAVGSEDERQVVTATNTLSTDTQKAGIETISEVINGQHTFDVWRQAFKQSIPWASNRIGATQCQATCY